MKRWKGSCLHVCDALDSRKGLIKLLHLGVTKLLPQVANHTCSISLDNSKVEMVQKIRHSLDVGVAELPELVLKEKEQESGLR